MVDEERRLRDQVKRKRGPVTVMVIMSLFLLLIKNFCLREPTLLKFNGELTQEVPRKTAQPLKDTSLSRRNNMADPAERAKALLDKYPTADFDLEDGEIKNWRTASITKPTSNELNQIVSAYRTKISDEAVAKRNRKKAVLTKLGLVKADIKAFLELIDDRNDE